MFKKLIFSFLSALILFQSVASTVIAAEPPPATWYNQGIQEWYIKVYDTDVSAPEEIFGERYTAAQVDWIIWSVLTWLPTKIINPRGTACLIGILVTFTPADGSIDFKNCWDYFFADAGTGPKYALTPPNIGDKSLLQMIFADRQFSGVNYVRNLAQKLTLVSEANAQGFGYTTALDPFKEMWSASRDVAYSLFVFAAIILAFMVMFRVKLNPQTAITVQSAIPKLIIALILVTFSYAIAGFMVDMMYVVIGLVSIIGAKFGFNGDPRYIYEFLTVGPATATGNPGGLFGVFVVYLIIYFITFVISGLAVLGNAGAWVMIFLSGIGLLALITTIATGLWIIILIIFFVAFVILVLAILWMMIKTWWTIMKAFVNIILLTIFAPFQLLLGTFIPSMGFSAWVKSYISELAVFVAVGFLFLLATIFCLQAFQLALQLAGQPDSWILALYQQFFGPTAAATPVGAPTPGWPPLIINSSSPEYYSFIYLMISMVVFFQIPKASDMIKTFISGRPWSYGTSVGEGLGLFGAAYGSGMAGEMRKLGSGAIADKSLTGVSSLLQLTGRPTAQKLGGAIKRQMSRQTQTR